MGSLYLNAWFDNDRLCVDVKTYIIIYIHQLSELTSVKIKIKLLKSYNDKYRIMLNPNDLSYEILLEIPDIPDLCVWPVLLLDNYVISGLCSVARQICKLSENQNVRNLLGFREACLMACAESSVWTKFCEIDFINTIDDLFECSSRSCFVLPKDILRYENHLSRPVRVHNIYKLARNNHNDQSLKSSTSREHLKVFHEYAEGPFVTLADHILYSIFSIFFKYCEQFKTSIVKLIKEKIPLTSSWITRMENVVLHKLNFSIDISNSLTINEVVTPSVENVTLYNAEHTKIVSVKHTKQHKIESALNAVKDLKDEIINSYFPFGYERKFNWNSIPIKANPKGGSLPKKRASRKCEQLENLAKAALEVVGNNSYKIVDFCSGSGHLGILVATLLPNCQIFLVENKERSLDRARESISKLELKNVYVIQSNLDYFVAKFDLGLALHACGVATDLVLQMCIKNKANFICCPCCYGGIKDCHEVSYPRSDKFKTYFGEIKNYYFNLAHAADQTHEEKNAKTMQGYFCMDVIDTDRKWFAESCGYRVHLGKLQPVSCTNKNNLLVGLYQQ